MLKRQIIREELSRHKTVTSKIKYIVFAFKFELIVAIVVLGFVGFFAHSILVHDNPVLNVGIYTPNKEINSLQISTTSEKLVKALHVNYNNHRDTVSITAGSTMKISDKTKMQSMLMAGQLDVLVVGKNDFNTLKKKTKNFKVIPNNLTQKINLPIREELLGSPLISCLFLRTLLNQITLFSVYLQMAKIRKKPTN